MDMGYVNVPVAPLLSVIFPHCYVRPTTSTNIVPARPVELWKVQLVFDAESVTVSSCPMPPVAGEQDANRTFETATGYVNVAF